MLKLLTNFLWKIIDQNNENSMTTPNPRKTKKYSKQRIDDRDGKRVDNVQVRSLCAQRRRPRRPPFLRVLSVGTGVTSSILPIFMPERAKARNADWAPGPGVRVRTPPVARRRICRALTPKTLHLSATS